MYAVPVFVLYPSSPVREKGLTLVRALATAAPSDALSLLPLLVHLLPRCTPSVTHHLSY